MENDDPGFGEFFLKLIFVTIVQREVEEKRPHNTVIETSSEKEGGKEGKR